MDDGRTQHLGTADWATRPTGCACSAASVLQRTALARRRRRLIRRDNMRATDKEKTGGVLRSARRCKGRVFALECVGVLAGWGVRRGAQCGGSSRTAGSTRTPPPTTSPSQPSRPHLPSHPPSTSLPTLPSLAPPAQYAPPTPHLTPPPVSSPASAPCYAP